MFERLWVRTPVLYNGWNFFHIDLLEKLYCLFEKTEKTKKRPRLALFKKNK